MDIFLLAPQTLYRLAIKELLEQSEVSLTLRVFSNSDELFSALEKQVPHPIVIWEIEENEVDLVLYQESFFNIPLYLFGEREIDNLYASHQFFFKISSAETGLSLESCRQEIGQELLPAIRKLQEKKSDKSQTSQTSLRTNSLVTSPQLILLGCSTGGPEALSFIFENLSKDLNLPILIVQHMPAGFTDKFARVLNNLTEAYHIKCAEDGDELQKKLCLIAPGDFHMTINAQGKISLNQSEKVCFVRPSVDVLFASVAQNFKKKVLALVLTGMGGDGAMGCQKLSEKGHKIIVQDEQSSTVWGMPGAVVQSGIPCDIYPLKDLPHEIYMSIKE